MSRGAIPPVSNLYADSQLELLQHNEMLKTVQKGKKQGETKRHSPEETNL